MLNEHVLTDEEVMPPVSETVKNFRAKFKPCFEAAVSELVPPGVSILESKVSLTEINNLAKKKMQEAEKEIIQKLKQGESNDGKRKDWNRGSERNEEIDDLPF